LGNKPKVHATSLLFATVLFGQVLLTPFYIWETVTFKPMPITLETIGGIAYLAVISSVVAYLAYNRTVELLGANKAGLTSYLLPIFGSLFAVILLGESIRLYHVVAFALIIGGVSLAARTKRRTI
jgi:drug/metabolite transporter (DMT)-like permease